MYVVMLDEQVLRWRVVMRRAATARRKGGAEKKRKQVQGGLGWLCCFVRQCHVCVRVRVRPLAGVIEHPRCISSVTGASGFDASGFDTSFLLHVLCPVVRAKGRRDGRVHDAVRGGCRRHMHRVLTRKAHLLTTQHQHSALCEELTRCLQQASGPQTRRCRRCPCRW